MVALVAPTVAVTVPPVEPVSQICVPLVLVAPRGLPVLAKLLRAVKVMLPFLAISATVRGIAVAVLAGKLPVPRSAS